MSKNIGNQKHGIFYVKPVHDSNNAIIKCAGLINQNEKIVDEQIECNQGENRFVHKFNDDIDIKFYRCNMPDWYLMTTRTIPILCATFIYQHPIVPCNLFCVLVEYNITSKIESEKKLINNVLDGNYQIRIDSKTNPLTVSLDKYETTPKMVNKILEFIEKEKETIQCAINQSLEDKRSERIQKFGEVKNIDIPIVTYKDKNLVNAYKKLGKLEINSQI